MTLAAVCLSACGPTADESADKARNNAGSTVILSDAEQTQLQCFQNLVKTQSDPAITVLMGSDADKAAFEASVTDEQAIRLAIFLQRVEKECASELS